MCLFVRLFVCLILFSRFFCFTFLLYFTAIFPVPPFFPFPFSFRFSRSSFYIAPYFAFLLLFFPVTYFFSTFTFLVNNLLPLLLLTLI